uniref:Integrase, catalytic core n=1 Tax=Tanacetum cinerariifolium TaxID=118510 RepID=A0A6L2JJ82_TANCI|nr:integrase, catalytic core [Tanacetum cinerariifolium]
MVYTPQQTAIVEKKHRHLLDTSRALKFHSSLPNKFYGDCVLTSTYLINKMPMKILDWKTPFEMLHGVYPSYDHLRVIGFLCFATVTNPYKDKFSLRSIKSVLIGYIPSQKGDKVYNLETHEVFCRRDVSLQETIFPFKSACVPYESPLITQHWPIEDTTEDEDLVPYSAPKNSPDNVIPNTPSNDSATPSTHENTSPTINPIPPTRKSTRTTAQPIWLKDFVTNKYREEIHMKPPEGYTKASQGRVCKLNKSLYSLKQASRQWNQENLKFLVTLGFIQSTHDYSLFVKAQDELFTVALVYVDNVLLTGNSTQDIKDTKMALDRKITIKDLGLARYFLGIELCNTESGTYLHQRKYVLDLLKDAWLTAAKPTSFPLPQNMKLSLDKGNLINDLESYRRIVGRLLYLSLTRTYISYVV